MFSFSRAVCIITLHTLNHIQSSAVGETLVRVAGERWIGVGGEQ